MIKYLLAYKERWSCLFRIRLCIETTLLIMPTNEGTTFSEVLEQTQNCEDFNDALSTNSKEDQKEHSDEDNMMDNLWIKPIESNASFESTPVKSKHEIFLRNFFEIMLQDAVFDVSIFPIMSCKLVNEKFFFLCFYICSIYRHSSQGSVKDKFK